ncbi:MAG: TonB-dependent receptor [Pseudomonadales bacterium]|nr:TonB-dependent receptor [Pseudomonadales bacterium]
MKPYIAFIAIAAAQTVAAEPMEEIIVTATLQDEQLHTLPISITVISEEDIQTRHAQHVSQLLNNAPNVNFASGASRGRFIQVRGIGERSQFKDPLDASVGLVVDGIDFSGIGLAGTLFDVQQVEILRGPQGTNFGANAMGGLINVRSNQPTSDVEGSALLGTGSYGSRQAGAVLSGPLSQSLSGRFAIHQFVGDGYTQNNFTGTSDTSDFDELTLRGKLRWQVSDLTDINLMATYIDADNGYDAFSLNNTRYTGSDEPGHDRQQSKGLVIALHHDLSGMELEASVFVENSDLEYGFDWDWSNAALSEIRGGENNVRQRHSAGADIRLSGGEQYNWVAGAHFYQRDVDLAYKDHWEDNYGFYPSSFASRFNTDRKALYGQVNLPFTDTLELSVGGRIEQYDDSYADTAGVSASPVDQLWGGRLSLEYLPTDNIMVYGSVSRGYKTGGINGQAAAGADSIANPDIAAFLTERLAFISETLISYEAGVRASALDDTMQYSLSVFRMNRDNMQAKAWVLFPLADWKSYLDNVDDGYNQGVEFSVTWQASDVLVIDAGLGLLDTELGSLTVQDIDNFPPTPVNQSNRAQAHAPEYQFFLAANYRISDRLQLNVQAEGKDDFFFSNGHDMKSDSISLTHVTLRYQLDNYEFSIWGRNVFDEDIKVRGFYFGNNPLNGWINEAYYQLGEPRTFGLTARMKFH